MFFLTIGDHCFTNFKDSTIYIISCVTNIKCWREMLYEKCMYNLRSYTMDEATAYLSNHNL